MPPTPPPPGGTGGGGGGGGGGGSSPHGTFVYVRNNPFPTGSTSGFRLNSDGALTALQGSPFSISGPLAIGGSFLLVSNKGTISSFQIDASSGALMQAGTAMATNSGAIAADATNVYVAGNATDGSATIFGFSIAANGSFTAISGSPFFFGNGCSTCDVPSALALDSRLLFVGGVGTSGAGDATVYTRGQGGMLANMQRLGTTAFERVAIQPAGNVAYGVDQSQGAIVGFTIDASGKPTQGSFTPDDPTGLFQDVAIDPSGKFLLAIDRTSSDSRIVVFSINPTTSGLSELGSPVSTGEPGGTAIAIDSSGKFVIVAHGAGSSAPNDVMVFTFDPTTRALMKVQSAPTGPNPAAIVIATL